MPEPDPRRGSALAGTPYSLHYQSERQRGRLPSLSIPISLFAGYGLGSFLLALAGLAGVGVRGGALLGRSLSGALFLSHWLVVVPTALVRIAIGPETTTFRKTPRTGHALADR